MGTNDVIDVTEVLALTPTSFRMLRNFRCPTVHREAAMNDRIRACSSLVALAIASVVALSACEQQDKPDDFTVARTTRALTTGLQAGDIAITCMNTQNPDSLQITPLVALDPGTQLQYTDREA